MQAFGELGEVAQGHCFCSLMNRAFVALGKESFLWGRQWQLREHQERWKVTSGDVAPVRCDFNPVGDCVSFMLSSLSVSFSVRM